MSILRLRLPKSYDDYGRLIVQSTGLMVFLGGCVIAGLSNKSAQETYKPLKPRENPFLSLEKNQGGNFSAANNEKSR